MQYYCVGCKKKKTCVKLCKIAEKYANKDYVPQGEYLGSVSVLDLSQYADVGYPWGLADLNSQAKIRKAIISMWKDGKSTREIAHHVPWSQSYISRYLKEYKIENL